MDYLVILSPGEGWQTIWLVLDAPRPSDAEKMVWTENGYNSGEPVRIRPVISRADAIKSATYTTTYDPARVEASKELIRYND